jgi:heme-degrading monooxygenase HmoA
VEAGHSLYEWLAQKTGGEPMIVRIWHGVTPASKADAYLDYLKATGLKEYRATEGNRGVQFLRKISAGRAEFLTVSYWESYDAIRKFAGEDIEKPVYYPEDKEYLLEFEPEVVHYEVLVNEFD